MGRAIGAIVVAAVGVTAALVWYVIMSMAGWTDAAANPDTCVLPTGPAPVTVADLNATQLRHAEAVILTGARRGEPMQALVVALSTVAQESHFLNYANDGTSPDLAPEQAGVAASLNYPHDAVGNDHGSVGIFQQQFPWWGTLAELMDPQIAAEKFYDALADVPGWESLPVTQAAQAVQRSAFPDAYAQWEPLAHELLDHYTVSLDGDTIPCGTAGPAGEGEWRLPLEPGTYRFSSPFGMRLHPILNEYRLHTGADFAAPAGTPIYAAAAGQVTHAGWQDGYGNLVIIETGNVEHYYAHQQTGSIQVDAEQQVVAGQLIGAVGTTGLSTGNHLHFEIRVNGTAIDPVPFLRQQGVEIGDAP